MNFITHCYLYDYLKKYYKKNVKIFLVPIKLEFSENNRKGIWIKNNLFLFVPIKNIHKYFYNKKVFNDWIERGVFHYIYKKIIELYRYSRYFEYNNDYYFELFMSIPDEKQRYEIFSEW